MSLLQDRLISVRIIDHAGSRLGIVMYSNRPTIEVRQAHTPGMYTFTESDTAYESFGDAVGAAVQYVIETVIDA